MECTVEGEAGIFEKFRSSCPLYFTTDSWRLPPVLPTENASGRVPEYLMPDDGTLDIIIVMGNSARVATGGLGIVGSMARIHTSSWSWENRDGKVIGV